MATDTTTPEPKVDVMNHLFHESLHNRALLTVLLNAVGELTAEVQGKDALEVKNALHERVTVARKQFLNTAFGLPADYERPAQDAPEPSATQN